MNLCKLLGNNLRFLRRAAGIATRGNSFSQLEIADFIGVSRKTIVFWESGHIPSRRMMGVLCDFFSRKLGLDEPLLPEQLMNEDISEYFFIVPERAEVKKVTPQQKKMLSGLFARASQLHEKDLEKIIEILDNLVGEL